MIDSRYIVDESDLLPTSADQDLEEREILTGEKLDSIHQTPSQQDWVFPYLYSEDQIGGLRVWKIGFDSSRNMLVRIHGHERTKKGKKGKVQVDELQIKMNMRSESIQSQALLEARNFYRLKVRGGYRPMGSSNVDRIPAQLAVQMFDKKTGRCVLTEAHLKNGVACQGKIDGFRGRIWDDLICLSRTNVVYLWLYHIKEELRVFFEYLPVGCGLDGEFFNFQMEFGEIQSAMMTTNYRHPKNQDIIFYIFDVIIPDKTLNERTNILYNAYQKYLNDGHRNSSFQILPLKIAYTFDQLHKYFKWFRENGYEGMTIRKCVGPCPTDKEKTESYYRGKRNNSLIKMKEFYDDEGIIVGVNDSKGRDKGTATLRIDWHGIRFGCRPGEKYETRKQWFENPNLVLGKVMTFTYFEISPDGVPRHATGKSLRDDEYLCGDSLIYDIYFVDEKCLLTLNFQSKYFTCFMCGEKEDHQRVNFNKKDYIGRKYYYRYMNYTKDGVPEKPLGFGFG